MNPNTSAVYAMFIQYILPVLFTGLAMLLGWALTSLATWLQSRSENSKIAGASSKLVLLTDTIVADLEATMKPVLKAATADGMLTKTEIDTLRATALQRLKEMAGEKGMEAVKDILGVAAPKLEEFLTGLIEMAVARVPRESTVPGVPVVPVAPIRPTVIVPPPPSP